MIPALWAGMALVAVAAWLADEDTSPAASGANVKPERKRGRPAGSPTAKKPAKKAKKAVRKTGAADKGVPDPTPPAPPVVPGPPAPPATTKEGDE